MNQRGEVTLFSILTLVALTTLLLLSAMELKHSFIQLQKRTNLFLCIKEVKGEIHGYLKFMGRTNWALANLEKAQMVLMFVPGMQGAALNVDKLQKLLIHAQNSSLLAYIKTLTELKTRGCPIDPQILFTPFELQLNGYKRDFQDRAILRKKKWTYYFLDAPYLISLKIDANLYQQIKPSLKYFSEEKGVKLSFLLSSR